MIIQAACLFSFSDGFSNAILSATIFCFTLYYSANIKITKKHFIKYILKNLALPKNLEFPRERAGDKNPKGFPTADPPKPDLNSQGVGKGNLWKESVPGNGCDAS